MSDAAFPSEGEAGRAAHALAAIRVAGGVRVGVAAREDSGTRLAILEERGGYRVRFPTPERSGVEAVVINIGGGVVGGDHVRLEIQVSGGDLTVATQAAERMYRSLGPSAEIDVALDVGPGARLDWLPQETILFSGARLRRRFNVSLAATSRLLMVESLVFGRTASGEVLGDGLLQDQWRVRRDGRLVFAEAMRLECNLTQLLARNAIGSGATAAAVLLLVGPDAEDFRDPVRASLAGARCDCGVSAWNGMLTVRMLGRVASDLRAEVAVVTQLLACRALPRVWSL